MNSNMKYDLDRLFADDPEMLKILSEISLDDIKSPPAGQPTVDEIINRVPIAPCPKPPAPLQAEPVRDQIEAAIVKPQTAGRKIGRIILNALFYCLIIAILSGAALFTFSGNTQKSYFGYRLYTVKTPSMTPQSGGPSGGFRAGDTILVKLCDPKTVQSGDIITYTPGSDPNIYLTHRVVKVLDKLNDDQGLFFVTKGDANPSEDPPIAAKAVVGKVAAVIPGAGGVIEFIRSNYISCLIAIVAAIGSVILLRMYFSDPNKKSNRMERENQSPLTVS